MERKSCFLFFLLINIAFSCYAQEIDSTFVREEFGEYRSKVSYTLKEQSYPEGNVLANGKPLEYCLHGIISSVFGKKRIAELRPYDMWIALHFDGVKERLAYVSFVFMHKSDRVEPFLTDVEMSAIEQKCKEQNYEYKYWLTNKVNYFTGIYNYISFKKFKAKKGRTVYSAQ